MKKMLKWLPVLVLGFLVIGLIKGLGVKPHDLPLEQKGKDFSHLKLLDSGKTLGDFKGQVVAIHLWATWCAICTREHPLLMTLKDSPIQMVGVAYKDNKSSARLWLSEQGNPYDLVLFDHDGILGLELGAYGIPETFLFDEQSRLQARFSGSVGSKKLFNETIEFIKTQSASK